MLRQPTRFRSWQAVALHLGLSAFRTEFRAARYGLATFAAKLGFGSGSSRRRGRRSTSGCRSGFFHGVHHALAHGHARAKTRTNSYRASAFIRGRDGDGLGHVILRKLAHVAAHVRAAAL